MASTEQMLADVTRLVEAGADTQNTLKILDILGVRCLDEAALSGFMLWGDLLPRANEFPYTEQQRNQHILWEVLDRTPFAVNCAFSIPFRALLAKHLFKKCGDGFVANEGCRFNYGHLIEVGKNVSWNHCCYVDAKGGVTFGDYAIMTEYTRIFTHGHSESDHEQRSYAPVTIGPYAKLYTACTILPGVTVGQGAIVATCAVVNKNVDDFTLVAGIPAKPIRSRKSAPTFDGLNHYMFANRLFQGDKE